jgi:hypothetical protein
MTTQLLSPSSNAAYTQVFRPLADASQEIKTSKRTYKAIPYVKIRTAFETDPLKIQACCRLINANSYCTKPYRLLSFVADGTRHAVGTIVPNLTWKCSSSCTATALSTAIQALQEDAQIWACKIAQTTDPNDLKVLHTELSEIIKTLKTSLKTVFLVYRTYHQNPNAGEEAKEVSEAHAKEAIAIQHKALVSLIQMLALLQETTLGRPEPVEPAKKPEPVEKSSDTPSEASIEDSPTDSTPPKKSVPPPENNAEAVTDEELDSAFDTTPIVPAASSGLIRAASQPLGFRFKTKREASQWLSKKIELCRKPPCTDGSKAYADLLRQIVGGKAPQPWINFGKTLNAQIKDPIASYHFFETFYTRYTEVLTKSNLQIQIEKPENFKVLLKSLCETKAPQSAYQALFIALLHDNKKIPYDYNSAYILQAIMNDPRYFPIFDPGHII